MKIIKKMKISIMAIFAITSISANASLLLEPHLGYNLAGADTYSSATYKYTGAQYGARIGAQYLGVMGGLGYNHSAFTLKITNALGSSQLDNKRDELGVFVGYNAPLLLRAWIGYFLSAKETRDPSNGDWKNGNTTELGLGFTGLPFLSINLIYRMVSLNKSYTSSTGVEATLDPTYSPQEIVVGVSVPFTLL